MARLRRLQIHYERVVSEALPVTLTAAWWLPGIVARQEWTPPTDVYETGPEWVVTLELAGLHEDEFEILLYPEALVVQGERPWRRLGEPARVHRAEIRQGRFHAAVPVPGVVDGDRVRVDYQDGLLRIHLPKTQEGPR